MFNGCTKLVGGMGTAYDANHVDAAYAHIDGGPSNPGYFSSAPTQELMIGDINGDHQVTISDVTALINLLLSNGEMPATADVDGNGTTTISDVTALISYLLRNQQ
jgi:hypothetical protein